MKKFRPRKKYNFDPDLLEELPILQIPNLVQFAFLDCPDHMIEKIIYCSRPDLRNSKIKNFGKLLCNFRSYVLWQYFVKNDISVFSAAQTDATDFDLTHS